jgi:D-beta-D-heptose 7-phosphate kinase/D-beta-D-heptose 1-phosphate adenosyltransferase
MKRAIFTVGWQTMPVRSRVTEFAVIPAPFPAARAHAPGAWRVLAESLDVDLSASWLIHRSAASDREFPAELRQAFFGVIAAATQGECARAIQRVQAAAARSRVISDFEVTSRRCAALRKAGRRIVFTNGVFDLFHVGHVRLLQAARAQGDALVVGINSDESARGLKGKTRPVIPQFARAELVAAVRGVDFCVIFGQDDPRALLRVVRPDVLVKGSEYALSDVAGRRLVTGWGGRVMLLPHIQGWSSSELIRRLGSRARGDSTWRD